MDYKLEKPIHGRIGVEKYQCSIEWKNGKIISDEHIAGGGKEAGPDPYDLLLSSLVSCTLITLRMYIDRKGWDIPEISVSANMFNEAAGDKVTTVIDRDVVFPNPVPEEQKTRLIEIAKQCPISKILEGDIKVRTFVLRDKEGAKLINYKNDEHTVEWRPELCQHSLRCWKQMPQVFDPKIKKWINPDGASYEELVEQIKKCPSGALAVHRNV